MRVTPQNHSRESAPKAQDFTNRRYRHRGIVDEVERAKNRTKSKVRARVEHVIGVIKRVFGFAKVRYRGLKASAGSLRWWKTPPAVSALDAPPRDEGARERCIREVDRDCFVQHPRIPEGVIAHPSEV
jgi:hypothetical protein